MINRRYGWDCYFPILIAQVAELVDALDSKSRFEKEKIVCRSGGIGRHDGFKIHCSQGLRVRFPPSVQKKLR